MVDRAELDRLGREALVERARRLGVERPEVMTRVELADEIVRRAVTDVDARRRARGWLGVARDLVASLIEQGLNMPDAAKLVREASLTPAGIRHNPPVATVTLAEIYAAQGHVRRALAMLDEVIAKEPDHKVARTLRDRLAGSAKSAPPDPAPDRDEDVEPPEAASGPQAAPAAMVASAVSEVVSASTAAVPSVVAHLHEPDATVAKGAQLQPSEPPPDSEVDSDRPTPVMAHVAPVLPKPADPVTSAVADAPAVSRGAAGAMESSVILVRGQGERVYVYWELGDAVFSDPRGRAVVRVVTHLPGWNGAERRERSLELSTQTGEAWLTGIPERAVVRAAAGFPSVEGFAVFTVAAELCAPAGNTTTPALRFTPHPATGPRPEARERATRAFARQTAG